MAKGKISTIVKQGVTAGGTLYVANKIFNVMDQIAANMTAPTVAGAAPSIPAQLRYEIRYCQIRESFFSQVVWLTINISHLLFPHRYNLNLAYPHDVFALL